MFRNIKQSINSINMSGRRNNCTVNGKTIDMSSCSNVSVVNGKVYVNGKEYKNGEIEDKEVIHLTINVEGNVGSVESDCEVTINGNVIGDVRSGMSIDITGDVNGDINSGMSVDINGNQTGKISSGMSATIKNKIYK